ncbi:MAG TPA: potassium-transporting ATPase subunit B, partial [Desulfosporosinus sp.]|nr:potassium-transporting ATPase subunit B [Desulfosporosinus sp.]
MSPAILARSVKEAFIKLNPKVLWTNPVMLVVEILAVLTTYFTLRDIVLHSSTFGFDGQIAAWLWMTVLFANFAEALAEGRGKAQAESLRKTRSDTIAKKVVGEKVENISAAKLVKGDIVLVETGELIPGDGEIIEGIASVDE